MNCKIFLFRYLNKYLNIYLMFFMVFFGGERGNWKSNKNCLLHDDIGL